jgi:glycerol kinase
MQDTIRQGRRCFIGIDQGSSATKVVAVSEAGRLVYETRCELSLPKQDGMRVEQDPEEIFAGVREALDETVRALCGFGMSILGIGLSCQRSSCLVWKEGSGEPLSPVISWRDTRGMDYLLRLDTRREIISNATGLPVTPHYSASKLRWLSDHIVGGKQPDVFYGPLASFLVQRLTNRRDALVDHTNAARTQLMNIHTLDWDPELLDLFGLGEIRLPAIRPTAFEYGMVQTPAGELPLLAVVGDQQAAMIGLGILHKQDGAINYGTGGFFMVNTGTRLVPVQKLMASVLYSSERETNYLVEGSVNAVGDALAWARNQLALFKDYGDVDALCRKAGTDVVAFIALNGVGAPHWEAGVASAFHGFVQESTTADMVRAVVEGIAFFVKDITRAMAASGITPGPILLSGGLSSLAYLTQIQADILDEKIQVSPAKEASALGAAYLAGMYHGTWETNSVKGFISQGTVVIPKTNRELLRRYALWKRLHQMVRELDAS